jgi:hypothetical protein
MVRIEAMVEGFYSTVCGMGCNLFSHEDVVKTLGSASICGYFVVKAELPGVDVDEAKVRGELSHSACDTAKFFIEISTEYDFMVVVDFGF